MGTLTGMSQHTPVTPCFSTCPGAQEITERGTKAYLPEKAETKLVCWVRTYHRYRWNLSG